MNEKKLKGKQALIAGGSGGIGKAVAAAFLRNGAGVCIIGRNEQALNAAKKELASLGDIYGIIADVADENAMRRVGNEIQKIWSTIDILVNAAGIYGPIGPITEVDPEEWHKAIDINLFGTFLATHEFVPLMKGKRGVVINFVGGGEGAYPNFTSYVAAKGGIARLTETVAEELKEKGIDVNALAPGAVNTKFLEDLLAAGPEKTGKASYERSLKQKDAGGVSPEKAAALCVWLASDVSRGITGKIISAVWDEYEKFPERIKDIASTDVYTLRRVRPGDRGFDWEEKEG